MKKSDIAILTGNLILWPALYFTVRESPPLVPAHPETKNTSEVVQIHPWEKRTASLAVQASGVIEDKTNPGDTVNESVWQPTREVARTWFKELSEEQFELVWNTDGFQDTFADCCRIWTIRQFVIDYEEREFKRWENHEVSGKLEDELQPEAEFLAEQFEDPLKIWDTVSVYSDNVVNTIYAGAPFDSSSKWDVFRALKKAKCFADLDKTLKLVIYD